MNRIILQPYFCRLALWIIALVPCALIAQNNPIRFLNLSIEDGLSQSFVYDILQDQQGFMWFATQDGLNRYDGADFKIFRNDPKDKNTIPGSYIRSIYQDPNGLIWIGLVNHGVHVFDPLKQTFERFRAISRINNRTIRKILGDRNGNIWIATLHDGVFVYNHKTKKYKRFGRNQLGTGLINNLFMSSKGQMWVSTINNGLALYDENLQTFRVFNVETTPALSANHVTTVKESMDGRLWIGTNNGLNILQEQEGFYSVQMLGTDKDSVELSSKMVTALCIDSEQNIWVGTNDKGLDRIHFDNGSPTVTNYQESVNSRYNISSNRILCLHEDEANNIWIGTHNGVSRFDLLKQNVRHYAVNKAEEFQNVDAHTWNVVLEDSAIIWMALTGGVARVDRVNNTTNFYPFEGFNPELPGINSVYCLHYHQAEDNLWVGTIDGLYLLKVSEEFEAFQYVPIPFRKKQNPQENNKVSALIVDDKNYLWVATASGLGRINLQNFNTEFYRHNPSNPNSLGSHNCKMVEQDAQGDIWVGTSNGGVHKVVLDENWRVSRFEQFTSSPNDKHSISHPNVICMWQDRFEANTLWFGTFGGGLNKFNKETQRFQVYTERDGLSNNIVYGILGSDDGDIWASTNIGISRFNPKTERFTKLKERDGLQSNEFNAGAYYKSSWGELFFGGLNGVNSFYSDQVRGKNVHEPKMAITQVKILDKPVSLNNNMGIKLEKDISFTEKLNLRYSQNNITFGFAALHYSNPEGIEYKYILEGGEEKYHFRSGREAFYTNLSPGTYTFKVYGATSDGVWSSKPASIRVLIHPPFWGQWWFRMIGGIIIVSIILAIYYYRVSSIKAQKRLLAQLVEKRTKTISRQKEQIERQKLALEVEKDKAEKLLTNILPAETAEELKNRGKARTRNYRMATVMFMDFIGFTKIAERMSPTELVRRLDGYFREFDNVIEKFQLEKIKTIGDAYMAAGGVPLRDKENPINTVLAALQIQNYMKRADVTEDTPQNDLWALRIGIHTGEVIAGVIGTKRIQYDIWGNTVNVASRIETACEQGKINISGKTFDLVHPFFKCTYRGKLAAKNKGEIDMYYVERIKPELSEDELGLKPNKQFTEYVNLHIYSSINYRKAERHIMKILKSKLSPNLHYHGIHHTYDVVQSVERLAIMEGVLDDDMFVLKSAATYHDAGFVEQYDSNEGIAVRMATDILPKYGYTDEQVDQVNTLIYATIVPHKPNSHLEEILCDADLDYLGRDDFHSIADTLRRELRDHGKIKSDRKWDEIQVDFLTSHRYFTKSARMLRQEKKAKHLQEIKDRLEADNYRD